MEQPESLPNPTQGLELMEPPGGSYELIVSPDKLKAYLRVQGERTASILTEDVKKVLAENRISYGLVDNERIEEYIRLENLHREPCLIAEGTPAAPGMDAQVIYHFDRDPLKIGKIKIKGGDAIDFKDKGEIPQVKSGTLLAEKIPLLKEKPGVDVFGNPVPIDKAKDIRIFCGPGTGTSTDGLKIYAKRDGRPILLTDGRISVLAELRIEGDVGLETGHIRFDGFVDIVGAIQQGFRVKAGKLAAKEIYRAEVEVDGDIVVDGGIIGAKISSRGNIRSLFIHSSRIVTHGDVMVAGEVIDSRIETNGALIAAPAGKLFGSHIKAKKGVTAGQIGSESSKPCVLTIGLDINQDIINALKKEIWIKTEEKKKITESIETLTRKSSRLKEGTTHWVQIQAQATREENICRKAIAELSKRNDPEKQAQAEQELAALREKTRSSDESLQNLMDQEDAITEKFSVLKFQIQELDATTQGMEYEIETILEAATEKDGPTVKVFNQIFSGTTVEGPHSRVVLKENLLAALIHETRESKITPEGNKISEWMMKISSLE